MWQAIGTWMLRIVDELPPRLGWLLLVTLLALGSSVYGRQTTRLVELEHADTEQRTQIHELKSQVENLVGQLREFTDELRLYRQATQEENRRLRGLADARLGWQGRQNAAAAR
jgi:chromosome segregation ATPase